MRAECCVRGCQRHAHTAACLLHRPAAAVWTVATPVHTRLVLAVIPFSQRTPLPGMVHNVIAQAASSSSLAQSLPATPPSTISPNDNLQSLDKARKDLEKARKVREPLTKKLAEDPQALDSLAAEVAELQQQLAAV